MNHNLVEFGLKNVYFAPRDGESFEKPIRMYGAASIQLSPVDSTEEEEFYNGEISYITINKGYQGQLNLAVVPEAFSLKCLRNELNTQEVLLEIAGFNPRSFALLFEFDGDKHKTRHVLFHCIASRPEISSETNGEKKSINISTLQLRVLPFGDNRVVKAKVKEGASTYQSWFDDVLSIAIN